jgi:hypothetical protein
MCCSLLQNFLMAEGNEYIYTNRNQSLIFIFLAAPTNSSVLFWDIIFSCSLQLFYSVLQNYLMAEGNEYIYIIYKSNFIIHISSCMDTLLYSFLGFCMVHFVCGDNLYHSVTLWNQMIFPQYLLVLGSLWSLLF